MQERIAKVIRIITIAPVMALFLVLELYILKPGFFGGSLNFVLAIVFLAILPVLAYPIQPIVPGYRGKGREGQRSLAIVMASLGYCFGIIAAVLTHAISGVWILYLTYFISGILIMLFNKVLKIRASGHACGVAGPIFASIYFIGPVGLVGFSVLAAVYWASMRTQRHRFSELVLGSCIPGVAIFLSIIAVSLLS